MAESVLTHVEALAKTNGSEVVLLRVAVNPAYHFAMTDPSIVGVFVSDLARRLGMAVVIVARNRLGCINHVLLTVESIQRFDCECAAIILNGAVDAADLAQSTNERELRRLLGTTVLVAAEGALSGALMPGWVELLTKTEPQHVLNKLTQV